MNRFTIISNRYLILLLLLLVSGCSSKIQPTQTTASHSINLISLGPNVYIHESYLETESFGKVGCNGLVYVNQGEAIVFDTPADIAASNDLINWITDSLDASIKVVIPTHFHGDAIGGLEAFHKLEIPSLSSTKTSKLAKAQELPIPKAVFDNDTSIAVGNQLVHIKYPGEGHTVDNVVGYIPATRTLFGGCLIKSLGASKGYTGDANVFQWSATVNNIKHHFPEAVVIVPGHGKAGNRELLDYTIDLFKQ